MKPPGWWPPDLVQRAGERHYRPSARAFWCDVAPRVKDRNRAAIETGHPEDVVAPDLIRGTTDIRLITCPDCWLAVVTWVEARGEVEGGPVRRSRGRR